MKKAISLIIAPFLLSLISCGSLSINTKHGDITIEKEKKPCILDSDIECKSKASKDEK